MSDTQSAGSESGHLPEPDDVRLARAVMERHYNEPVRPISHYCKAFEQWADALVQRKRRLDALPAGDVHRDYRDDTLDKLADVFGLARLAICKSSMLGRLIYGGERLRTEMCPEHQGRWVGLEWVGDKDACPHGCQKTGWLPS